MSSATVGIPGTTQCLCPKPRYLRCIDGVFRSLIYQGGEWVLINDHASRCRGCGLVLRERKGKAA